MIAPASRPSSVVLRSVLGLALATAGLVSLSSCTSVPLTAPTESTITVYANPTTVALGAQATVTATVIEKGGTAVQDGTQVTFTTTLGSVSPTETTTRGGRASVTFFAGSTSGTARVTAYSGAASGSGSTSSGGTNGGTATVSGGPGAYVDILIGGAAATKIAVSASPATLPSSGGTSTILAIVTDDAGNRQPQVPVSFSTTAGTLSATSANTDSNGEARVQLTTTRAADVTATVGKAEGKISITLNTQLGITLTPPPSLQSETPALFTIGVAASAGSVVREAVVEWGDGSRLSLGALSGSTSVTHIYLTPGNYSVSVTATDTNGESTRASTAVTVIPVQVNVTLTGPSTARIGDSVTFTAQVSPATLGRVRQYQFRMGDGTTPPPTIVSSTTASQQHSYAAVNRYTVTVEVQLTTGEVYTAQFSINVTV